MFTFIIIMLWHRLEGVAAPQFGASMGSYMYSGLMFLYSPRDNVPSVLAIGYNSIQRPVLVVFLSVYNYYYLLHPVLSCSSLAPCHVLYLAPRLPWVFPKPTVLVLWHIREETCMWMLRAWQSRENAIGYVNRGTCECWERAKSEKIRPYVIRAVRLNAKGVK